MGCHRHEMRKDVYVMAHDNAQKQHHCTIQPGSSFLFTFIAGNNAYLRWEDIMKVIVKPVLHGKAISNGCQKV